MLGNLHGNIRGTNNEIKLLTKHSEKIHTKQ